MSLQTQDRILFLREEMEEYSIDLNILDAISRD